MGKYPRNNNYFVIRKKLRNQITTMLVSPKTNDQLVDKLIELLFVVVPDVDNALMTLTEVISEIREPLTQVVTQQSAELTKQQQVTVRHNCTIIEFHKFVFQLSGYKLALNNLKEKEYEAASSKNYSEAAQLQEEIKELELKIENLKSPAQTVLSEVVSTISKGKKFAN